MVLTMEKMQDTFDPKPRKFIVWLFVVSSTIMFGGFTSYYLVFAASKGKGHGLVLPDAFIYSSLVIIASSITLVLASKALKKLNFSLQRNMLWITVILAIAFGVMQFVAVMIPGDVQVAISIHHEADGIVGICCIALVGCSF